MFGERGYDMRKRPKAGLKPGMLCSCGIRCNYGLTVCAAFLRARNKGLRISDQL